MFSVPFQTDALLALYKAQAVAYVADYDFASVICVVIYVILAALWIILALSADGVFMADGTVFLALGMLTILMFIFTLPHWINYDMYVLAKTNPDAFAQKQMMSRTADVLSTLGRMAR